MEAKHIKNNAMYDLNDIAKTSTQLENDVIMETLQQQQIYQAYLLYVTSDIVFGTIIAVLVKHSNKIIKKRAHPKRRQQPLSEAEEVPLQSVQLPNTSLQASATDERDPENTDITEVILIIRYPRLRTDF